MSAIIGAPVRASGTEEICRMALTFDIRQPSPGFRSRNIHSKVTYCLELGSIVSSFTFILALLIGVF